MTDLHDNDEPRDLRPHERDPDAEPPEADERDVTLALAALAGSPCSGDGLSYGAEFLTNLKPEHLNAFAHGLYTGASLEQLSKSFRELFAADFEASVRTKLRSA